MLVLALMLQGDGHCHRWAIILAKLSLILMQVKMLRGQQDWQAPRCSMQGDRPPWFCVGAK